MKSILFTLLFTVLVYFVPSLDHAEARKTKNCLISVRCEPTTKVFACIGCDSKLQEELNNMHSGMKLTMIYRKSEERRVWRSNWVFEPPMLSSYSPNKWKQLIKDSVKIFEKECGIQAQDIIDEWDLCETTSTPKK